MTLKPLSAPERARGWVEHTCPEHGGLVAGPVGLTVVCRCRKRAVPYRSGKPVAKATLHRLRQAKNGST